ncbi:uncharacterized protein B0H18DRAFT_1034502 [Fomitopsis serialis]|uniref:uncharacterized protein n=1 Tax=Fomitopsis serialis TaxID=139415 RepID=UPI00200751A6|nr:uncharacterized protein B0H18DRAFT_1034502 [Neoantrodia serialis]KAH9917412.1 hypothetical protein B0H18DRAFT_1034502 [Neoantrodia serialis]
MYHSIYSLACVSILRPTRALAHPPGAYLRTRLHACLLVHDLYGYHRKRSGDVSGNRKSHTRNTSRRLGCRASTSVIVFAESHTCNCQYARTTCWPPGEYTTYVSLWFLLGPPSYPVLADKARIASPYQRADACIFSALIIPYGSSSR